MLTYASFGLVKAPGKFVVVKELKTLPVAQRGAAAALRGAVPAANFVGCYAARLTGSGGTYC